MGLATNVSRESGSRVPLGEAAEMIYMEAVERYPELSRKDFSAVYARSGHSKERLGPAQRTLWQSQSFFCVNVHNHLCIARA